MRLLSTCLSSTGLSIALVSGLLGACPAWAAELRMPGIFGDHMVLQQGRTIPVWGWADPGVDISVTFGAQTVKTKTAVDGKWRVDLAKTPAQQTAQRLIVTGKTTLTFEDVLVGDVWLCSGQSNMEFGILNIRKFEECTNPKIRVFCLTRSASLTPMDNTTEVPKELVWDTSTGHWDTNVHPGNWNGFSAVGYLFGQRIQAFTGNPVGLIGSHWGGTPVQAWTSLPALEKEPTLADAAKQVKSLNPEQKKRYPVVWADYVAAMRTWSAEVWEPDNTAMRKWEEAAKLAKEQGTPEPEKPKPTGVRPNPPGNEGMPSTLFNGMINPLIPYAITGVIWYQGESNAWDGEGYGPKFSAMIRDWRERWGQGDIPFLFVQVAGYGPSTSDPTRGRWASLREGQRKALALPNTAMAVAIDVGDKEDIHPRNKGPVADRLALAAEHLAYGKDVVYSGPTFVSMKADGNRLRITFTDIGTGLVRGVAPAMPGAPATAPASELLGFEIAGADQKWFHATAAIDGASVIVSSAEVAAPVAVRYAWGDIPPCNLYNKEGLPAVPFRSDAWDAKAAFETPK